MGKASSLRAAPRVLPTALLPLTVFLALGCTCLTEPTTESGVGATSTPKTVKKTPAEKVAEARPLRPEKPAEPIIGASHILISYAGATRSTATRTKEEARAVAQGLLERIRKGEDFGDLAVLHSEDPTAKANRGNLGETPASSWVKPFSDAALALEVGEVSDLVETPFGIHIIKREQ